MKLILPPIKMNRQKIEVLDQKLLPHQELYTEIANLRDGYLAIKEMKVRGAPLIGFTAIYTMGVWCREGSWDELDQVVSYLNSARPTAVNLSYELKRVKSFILEQKSKGKDLKNISLDVFDYASKLMTKANEKHLQMAQYAEQALVKKFGNRKLTIMTHCNAGWLACGTMGTAVGVISYLASQNRIKNVWVDETRPYLQGSRLTAFELYKEKIPHQIVVEGAAHHLMKNKLVDAIFVGADRIAANGDTANKIGTANLSVLAKHFNIPFYIVAPLSTFDLETPSGQEIEIELRDEAEIKSYKSHHIAPLSSKAFNPSFDISDAINITGIVCEQGIASPVTPQRIKDIYYGH